jgi:AcrR family transcriptional regulator
VSGEPPIPGVEELRARIMEATLASAEDAGVRGFSLEDVATRAGVSRTTIYNHFPGGRSQLVEQTATWEIARFWGRLAAAVEALPTLEDRLVAGLVIGRKVMTRSRILANLMDPDLQVLLAAVRPSEPIIHGVIRDYMRDALADELAAGTLREGTDIEAASDYLMRMLLSWLGSPAGVDLTDEAAARRVVRSQFLVGILADRSE